MLHPDPMMALMLKFLYERRMYNDQFFNGSGIPQIFIEFAQTKGLKVDPSEDAKQFRETFWWLVSKGLASPGSDCSNDRLPHVSITDYGIRCIEEERIIPYDPSEFLDSISRKIVDLDEIIKLYLNEAVSCFLNFNYLSATVMTGCALERLILFLTEEVYESIDDADLKLKFESDVIKKRKIKTKFDNFVAFIEVEGFKAKLSLSSREKFETLMPAVFTEIRITRNESGHPTGREIEQDEAHANILLAKPLLLYIYNSLLVELKNLVSI